MKQEFIELLYYMDLKPNGHTHTYTHTYIHTHTVTEEDDNGI